ncbi:MAG: ABC transporter permease, partial [Paracraurococcus sp.]
FDPRRLLACAWRECLELLRDRIRLGFALLGPMVLILAFGFGISFDVEDLPYAGLDQDQTPESRELLESFAGSRYFRQQPPLRDLADAEARLQAARIALYIEIPPGFGRDLLRGARPEVSVILDGAMPFRAETIRGYVTGLAQAWLAERNASSPLPATQPLLRIQPRFRYNQGFRSSVAILPGVMMLILIVIPAMMSAVGVVREKETGAIANFRATPVTALEFLVGKQLPYVAVGLLNLAFLLLTMRLVFAVPVQGSGATLALGGLVYVIAATAFGLLISAFVRTQVAAIFAAAVLSIVPAVNFSGLLVPAASLSGFGRAVGTGFPAGWFQQVAIGTIDKGLGFTALWLDIAALGGFAIAFIAAAALALRKQEA